jgi:phosphotransferase system HPr-like phosphotransfer protein
LKFSNENGVMTRPAWKLMHELQMFKDCISNDIVIAKEISDKLVNLPSSSLIN